MRLFEAGLIFILAFYLAVPLLLTVHTIWKGRQERLAEILADRLRDYREWLLSFTHIFFSGIALLLTVFVAMVALQYVTTSYEMNSASVVGLPPGQTVTQIDRVLQLAEVMFGFFGLILSLFTVVGAIFAWWLRKSVEMTIDETKALRKKLDGDAGVIREELQENLRFAKSSALLAADIALTQIPDVTFSQQIPAELIGSFRALERIWENPKYWEDIVNSENGVRIRYARALFLMGTTDWVRAPNPTAGDSRTDVVSLLTDARDRAIDTSLQRNIRVRLFQALRQARRLDEAQKVLGELQGLSDRDRIVFRWGTIVLNLQKGLEVRDMLDRREYFQKAVDAAESLHGTPGVSSRDTAAVNYYRAKAYWSYRFSWGRNPVQSTLPPEKWTLYGKRFDEAAKKASDELESAISSGISDDLTKAIYLVSKAYLVVAWAAYPEATEVGGASGAATGAADARALKANGHSRSRHTPADLLAEAKRLLQAPSKDPIYNDHSERLESIDEFRRYQREVERFASDPEELWAFYQTTT